MKLNNFLKQLMQGEDMEIMYNYGYVISPHCIRRCIRLSQEEKMLLLEIYSLYNEDRGYAFPTQQTLGLFLGVTSSTISKIIKRLEEKEFIISKGRKGAKKRYYPNFNISQNPYIILSEIFHFAVRTINNILPNELGSDWANALLRVVNVKKENEFSDTDYYGIWLKDFTNDPDKTKIHFLEYITNYVEQLINEPLDIDWKKEINNRKKKEKHSIDIYKESSKGKIIYGKNTLFSPADIDEEWLKQLEESD